MHAVKLPTPSDYASCIHSQWYAGGGMDATVAAILSAAGRAVDSFPVDFAGEFQKRHRQ